MIHRRSFLTAAAAATSTAVLPTPVSARQTPDCPSTTIVLRDGRRLGYSTYGDAGGWPVLYFHGIPTSRIEARFFAPAARRAGCRLIAIDRPGYGSSDFQQRRRVVDWLNDVNEFVTSPQLPADLDLRQFSIACFSSGAAYALLCAVAMPPEQLKSVGVVDGIAPLEKIHGKGGVSQIVFRLANRHPQVTSRLLVRNARQMRRRPHIALRRTSRFFSPCDRSVFDQPDSASILVDSFLECVRCGPRGVVHDMSLLSQPWGYCIEDVRRPTGLWYGNCDITTPVASMGNYLNRVIPDSTLTVFPGQGHLSMLNAAGDEMFRQLLATVG